MTAASADLRRLARLAHLAHGLTLLRMLFGAAVVATIEDASWDAARPIGRWVSLGLGLVVLCVVSVAAMMAARAGVARATGRFAGALLAWSSVALLAQARGPDDARALAAAAAMAIDLALIAWCALLGSARRAAGATGAGWHRGVAYASMGVHIAVQLAPLALLNTLGAGSVAAIAIGSTVVVLGAATTDAFTIQRALPVSDPELPALSDAEGGRDGDDPWRPGG